MAELGDDLLEGIARLFIAEDVRNLCCPAQFNLGVSTQILCFPVYK